MTGSAFNADAFNAGKVNTRLAFASAALMLAC